MIVVTGAYGFIGSNLVRGLNKLGITNLLIVDDFDAVQKVANLEGCLYEEKLNRTVFLEWFVENADNIEFVFHLGARTDTTEFNFRILDSLNLAYSKALWEICTRKDIPIIYASSAATYGMGEHGFDDDEQKIELLKPLNPYGLSKQLFDMFVIEQEAKPSHWMGLKFFNVYGPHETHKGRMASVIYHAFHQISETGALKLFQSHHNDFKNGEQLRDFVFVDDVVAVCLYFYNVINTKKATVDLNGIYNLGTGQARTFNDLGKAVFSAMRKPEAITYIPIPEDIRDKYQYFTEANMAKLKRAGFNKEFTALEDGVQAYVRFLEANTN